MSYQVAAAVAAGELTILLASYEQPPIPVHLVAPSARSQAAKQRAFVAFAVPRLKAVLHQVALDIAET